MSDIVVRHRPFWSFFIQGTENWLGRMSLSGLHLCGLSGLCKFEFCPGESQRYAYRFVYSKYENPQKNRAQKLRGWARVAGREKWSVFRSADAAGADIPNRRGLYLRNNSLLCLYALLSSIVLLLLLGGVFSACVFSSRVSGSDHFFRSAVTIIGVFAVLLLCNFVGFLYMTALNSRVLDEPGDAIAPEIAYHQFLRSKTFEKWLEKLLLRDGDIFKSIHPLWLMSPRSFENWLERREQRGFNIYKVHKTGSVFYFIKGAPRKIRYCVINSEGSNVSKCLSQGWQVVYSTPGRLGQFGKLAIICHTYESKPPLPFSSEKDYVSNAARIMLKFVLFYFVLLILSTAALFFMIYYSLLPGTVIAALIVAFFTALIVKSLFYFVNSVFIARRGYIKISAR